MGETI